jgi:D-3-phosphoglycerate dehydrogenase
MDKWKILLTDGLEENGQALLREKAESNDKAGISADELLTVVGDYDALIVRGRTKVTPAVFQAAKKLKVVGRAGVGVDNIDLNAAREHGVTVVNAPTATTIAVAELTIGLMLAVLRELPRADSTMKNGKWLKKELEGNELWNKTLGVIGFGRIGSAVAKRAAAFDMKILAYDPELDRGEIVLRGGEPKSLEKIYALSDIITIHVPLNDHTRNMIGAAAIQQMKPGVRIICAARGGVVDEQALLDALESGHVAGVGLDVFGTEPPGDSPLISHPRVVCTPHVGAQTVEAQSRAATDIACEVLSALAGEPLRWQVA